MRVGFVSTWGVRCGISTYTEQLSAALARKAEVVIFAQDDREGARPGAPELPVKRAWHRGGGGAGAINLELLSAAVAEAKLDVLHFQHEFGLFPDLGRFLDLLQRLQKAGTPVAITLHTTLPYGGPDSRSGFLERLKGRADAVIVHTRSAATAVLLAGVPEEVVRQIPHGTPKLPAGDRARGFERLGLPEGTPVCLVLGLMSGGKNLMGTVRGIATALSRRLFRGPLVCVITGEDRDELYVRRVAATIVNSGYTRELVLRDHYWHDEEAADLFAAASFGVLNTLSHTLSASGQVHAYAAHGVPLIVANRPIYSEAVRAGAIPFFVDGRDPEAPSDELLNALGALANSKELREAVRADLREYADDTAWSELVEDSYLPLYQKLVSNRGA